MTKLERLVYLREMKDALERTGTYIAAEMAKIEAEMNAISVELTEEVQSDLDGIPGDAATEFVEEVYPHMADLILAETIPEGLLA